MQHHGRFWIGLVAEILGDSDFGRAQVDTRRAAAVGPPALEIVHRGRQRERNRHGHGDRPGPPMRRARSDDQRQRRENPHHVQAGHVELQRVDVRIGREHERNREAGDDAPAKQAPGWRYRRRLRRAAGESRATRRARRPIARRRRSPETRSSPATGRSGVRSGAHGTIGADRVRQRLVESELDEHPLDERKEFEDQTCPAILGIERECRDQERHREDDAEDGRADEVPARDAVAAGEDASRRRARPSARRRRTA